MQTARKKVGEDQLREEEEIIYEGEEQSLLEKLNGIGMT